MSCSLFNLISFYLLFVAQKGAKRPGTEAKSVIIAFAHKSQATFFGQLLFVIKSFSLLFWVLCNSFSYPRHGVYN